MQLPLQDPAFTALAISLLALFVALAASLAERPSPINDGEVWDGRDGELPALLERQQLTSSRIVLPPLFEQREPVIPQPQPFVRGI